MKVIHDDEMGGILMIPLIVDWEVSKTCQAVLHDADGKELGVCAEPSNTILVLSDEETDGNGIMYVGICETHHRAGVTHPENKMHLRV
jgi:hypothetical protein